MVWATLQPFVEWLGSSEFAQWLGQSTNRIAGLFVIHLIGLTLLLGGTLVIGLRLLDIGLRSQPVAGLARDIAPVADGWTDSERDQRRTDFHGWRSELFRGTVVPVEDDPSHHRFGFQLHRVSHCGVRRRGPLQSLAATQPWAG
jgi:hypothetical protein